MKPTEWLVLLPFLVLAVTGQSTEDSVDMASSAPMTSWQCRNDLEIRCDDEACEAEESFTSMDVQVDEAGSMVVCVYSGCWEGTGTVAQSEAFVVLTGHRLPFSTAPDSEDRKEDIVIAIDKSDQVAILKAGAFAQPLRCSKE